MSDEEKNANEVAVATAAATEPSEQPDFDEHTTEPHASDPPSNLAPPAPGKWEMPKPKFQQTSGYLPQGYLKDMEAAAEAAKPQSGSEDTTQEQVAHVPQPSQLAEPAAVPDIEPQPDLSDQLIPAELETQTSPSLPAKKSGASAIMIVLGLIAVLIFASLFLAAVYFLFLAKPAQSQF